MVVWYQYSFLVKLYHNVHWVFKKRKMLRCVQLWVHHRRNIRFPAVTDQALRAARPKGPSSHLSVAYTMCYCCTRFTCCPKWMLGSV